MSRFGISTSEEASIFTGYSESKITQKKYGGFCSNSFCNLRAKSKEAGAKSLASGSFRYVLITTDKSKSFCPGCASALFWQPVNGYEYPVAKRDSLYSRGNTNES